jgi:hypothetical protein
MLCAVAPDTTVGAMSALITKMDAYADLNGFVRRMTHVNAALDVQGSALPGCYDVRFVVVGALDGSDAATLPGTVAAFIATAVALPASGWTEVAAPQVVASPFPGPTCDAFDSTAWMAPGVAIERSSNVVNPATSVDLLAPALGDQISFICDDGTIAPSYASVICLKDGTWEPELSALAPIVCDATATPMCPDRAKVAASVVREYFENGTIARELYDGLTELEAPYPAVRTHTLRMHCDGNAEMLLDVSYNGSAAGAVAIENNSIPLLCATVDQRPLWNVDVAFVRCRCTDGFIQGSGAKSSECVDCRDGTYAPLNQWGARAECRACPREGVDCTGGTLTILKDFWYDVNGTQTFLVDGVTSSFDDEGKHGLLPTTKMYKCMQRDACLLDERVTPMQVRCHENHTGVLCARCYHRRHDCGRTNADGSPGYQDCAQPGWLEGRGLDIDWMYFATLARHCTRCPSGSQAYISYGITIAIGVVAALAIMGLIAHRLFNVWKRLHGQKRSRASGVARVFFNWMQMMSMLQVRSVPPLFFTSFFVLNLLFFYLLLFFCLPSLAGDQAPTAGRSCERHGDGGSRQHLARVVSRPVHPSLELFQPRGDIHDAATARHHDSRCPRSLLREHHAVLAPDGSEAQAAAKNGVDALHRDKQPRHYAGVNRAGREHRGGGGDVPCRRRRRRARAAPRRLRCAVRGSFKCDAAPSPGLRLRRPRSAARHRTAAHFLPPRAIRMHGRTPLSALHRRSCCTLLCSTADPPYTPGMATCSPSKR